MLPAFSMTKQSDTNSVCHSKLSLSFQVKFVIPTKEESHNTNKTKYNKVNVMLPNVSMTKQSGKFIIQFVIPTKEGSHDTDKPHYDKVDVILHCVQYDKKRSA